MSEQILDSLYHQIAGIVIDTIPQEWSKVVLYGEIVEGSQPAFFYYYPKENDKPIYSHDITELFNISESSYTEKWHQLLDFIQNLWKEFEDNGQEPWTNFTLVLNNTGEFKIDYNYDDISNTDPHERKIVWKYENLGILPKSNSGKKHLKKFLQTDE